MANLTTDLINMKLTAAQAAAIKTAVSNIKGELTDVTRTLTPKQRKSLYSFGLKRRVTAREALQEASNNGSILPPAISISKLENDLDVGSQLHEVERDLMDLLQCVRDTKRLAGHEAYTMTLAIHKFFNILAKAGAPGAQHSADRLGRHFLNNPGPSGKKQDYSHTLAAIDSSIEYA